MKTVVPLYYILLFHCFEKSFQKSSFVGTAPFPKDTGGGGGTSYKPVAVQRGSVSGLEWGEKEGIDIYGASVLCQDQG